MYPGSTRVQSVQGRSGSEATCCERFGSAGAVCQSEPRRCKGFKHEPAYHATEGADLHIRVHGSAQRHTVLLQPLLLLCRFQPEVDECAG